jgi:hypothetical protein
VLRTLQDLVSHDYKGIPGGIVCHVPGVVAQLPDDAEPHPLQEPAHVSLVVLLKLTAVRDGHLQVARLLERQVVEPDPEGDSHQSLRLQSSTLAPVEPQRSCRTRDAEDALGDDWSACVHVDRLRVFNWGFFNSIIQEVAEVGEALLPVAVLLTLVLVCAWCWRSDALPTCRDTYVI